MTAGLRFGYFQAGTTVQAGCGWWSAFGQFPVSVKWFLLHPPLPLAPPLTQAVTLRESPAEQLIAVN